MTQAINKIKKTGYRTILLGVFVVYMVAFWGFKAPFASADVFTSTVSLSQTQNQTIMDSLSPTTYTTDLVVSFCASLTNPLSCVMSVYQYSHSSGGYTALSPLPAIDKDNPSYWQAQGFDWTTSHTYFLEWRTNDSNNTLLSSTAITSYFSPDSLGVQRSHWTVGSSIAPDSFTVHLSLPDDTSISSGYDYVGDNFGGIKASFVGTNSLGLYDTFYINVYEDGTKVVDNVQRPINISCQNCELSNGIFSDFGYIYKQGHNYLFDIGMGGILSQTIKQSFSVSYNISAGEIIYETCNTGDFFCYMRNALRWAFTIPPTTFEKFTELKASIQNKAPFGYVTGIYTTLGSFNNSTNGVYTLGQSSDINNMIFTPIKNGLSWFLYIMVAVVLFKRFKDINI